MYDAFVDEFEDEATRTRVDNSFDDAVAGNSDESDDRVDVIDAQTVSYTQLTLPTIYSV